MSYGQKQTTNWPNNNLSYLFEKHGLKPIKTIASSINETSDEITVQGKGFKATISKKTGLISSYQLNGNKILVSPLKPYFWRPLTDNDERGWKAQDKLTVWKNLPENLKVSATKVSQNTANVSVHLKHKNVALKLGYTFMQDGTVDVEFDLSIPDDIPEPIRVGMTTGISKQLQQMSFLRKRPI